MEISYTFSRKDSSNYVGVYAIRIDNHLYIGSTKRGIWQRISEHKRMLENNRHYNSRMQRWFNIGKKTTFRIIEYCRQSDVCKREQYWIDHYDPDINIIRKVANY